MISEIWYIDISMTFYDQWAISVSVTSEQDRIKIIGGQLVVPWVRPDMLNVCQWVVCIVKSVEYQCHLTVSAGNVTIISSVFCK